ncbi:MAG: hypothetical protein UV52_C0033G0003 [Parcubacteria group bacterium GW2011_GWD1_42_9]|uniref:Uncharacterized protein n=2 Tax=Candidatus Vebleniibacteriota TaxID=1817921 RepID=A0A1G2Q2Z8_9BACT|nr:MAG: hypothetical protein UV52_C0033G0003 [Parcubacteria group bacterium GW2011_GWD1_42_9]KKS92937.1 MAG: hypothetical protein UV69_C0018G0014 [Parcubacteria group bacterium GW2011_GWE2_43_12]OHA54937.1 MAG: hypothetical protein A2429_00550 [Candidatus Veblenbacteria bacterium RIFOXYC1_FULL_42_9]OHA55402.1 MAG: hypothetical protein A2388_00690 [Candidatus Veblenbacteria bacterium RIFOXYB1_FULL_43_13]
MSYQGFLRVKPIITIALLLGVLGVGLMSTWYMDHNVITHQGCVGVIGGMPPCASLADIASCLQVHLKVIQGISQVIPSSVSQLLVLFVIAAILCFWLKQKRHELDAQSHFHLRWQSFIASLNILPKKIEQWLTLHEKRDPAPATLMVLGILPVPIM